VKATEFKVEGNTLVLPGPVTFVPASDKLTPASDAVLQLVEDYLDAKPEVTLLRVEGHTSSEGNVAVNQALSEKRALAVVRWLVGVGIKCERLLPVGFGHTKPIVPNDTRENRATNERIVVVAAQIGGKAPSGLAVDGGGKGAGNPCK
jgi:OOP family OmpA-OmpF porin